SRSRTVGVPFPLLGCEGSFFAIADDSSVSCLAPISSTEQIPIPYALRSARLTARVSATRISAPWTRYETFDGSASPNPTKPLHVGDLKIVATNAQRPHAASQKSRTG